MALSDVMKKKQETSGDKKSKAKVNLLEDIRVFIAILIIACVAIIFAITYGVKSNDETIDNINSAVKKYNENQASIANLHALQSKSSEYKAQRDEYDAMISREPLNQQQIMIDMEKTVESYKCTLSSITFGETKSSNGVNEIQVNITISGTYNNMMKFAYDTVNGQQIKRIDTIKMTPAKKDSSSDQIMSADLVVVLFSK